MYLNCGERYEDIDNHHSCMHNLECHYDKNRILQI